MNTWLYVLDTFKPIDIDTGKLFELAEENPLKLFNMFRDVLEEYVKDVKEVRVYDVYFDVKTFELLIEYIVRCKAGEVSVKLIHSNNPAVTLRKYYEHERKLKHS